MLWNGSQSAGRRTYRIRSRLFPARGYSLICRMPWFCSLTQANLSGSLTFMGGPRSCMYIVFFIFDDLGTDNFWQRIPILTAWNEYVTLASRDYLLSFYRGGDLYPYLLIFLQGKQQTNQVGYGNHSFSSCWEWKRLYVAINSDFIDLISISMYLRWDDKFHPRDGFKLPNNILLKLAVLQFKCQLVIKP